MTPSSTPPTKGSTRKGSTRNRARAAAQKALRKDNAELRKALTELQAKYDAAIPPVSGKEGTAAGNLARRASLVGFSGVGLMEVFERHVLTPGGVLFAQHPGIVDDALAIGLGVGIGAFASMLVNEAPEDIAGGKKERRIWGRRIGLATLGVLLSLRLIGPEARAQTAHILGRIYRSEPISLMAPPPISAPGVWAPRPDYHGEIIAESLHADHTRVETAPMPSSGPRP
jgi:hypothetical protein